MKLDNATLIQLIFEIQALAQNGLAYTKNEFDIERYSKLREIAAKLSAHYGQHESLHTWEDFNQLFSMEVGYATPKLDVRSFTLKDNKVLMVKERSDSLWSLPGGWIDVGESPSESVIRETKEETGFDVRTIKLLALWDKLKHDHPLQWPHTYKCFFQCEIVGGAIQDNMEISEVAFFDVNALPELSINRITKSQIERLYQLVLSPKEAEFD